MDLVLHCITFISFFLSFPVREKIEKIFDTFTLIRSTKFLWDPPTVEQCGAAVDVFFFLCVLAMWELRLSKVRRRYDWPPRESTPGLSYILSSIFRIPTVPESLSLARPMTCSSVAN